MAGSRGLRLLFGVSDTLANLLLVFGVLSAVVYPFAASRQAAAAGLPDDLMQFAGVSALWLATSIGAFALTRRQPWGLLLALLPAGLLVARDSTPVAALYAAIALLVFGTPLLLAWRESRAGLPRT